MCGHYFVTKVTFCELYHEIVRSNILFNLLILENQPLFLDQKTMDIHKC